MGAIFSIMAHLIQCALGVGLPYTYNALAVRCNATGATGIEGYAEDVAVAVDLAIFANVAVARPS
jgi:hypothetical protein